MKSMYFGCELVRTPSNRILIDTREVWFGTRTSQRTSPPWRLGQVGARTPEAFLTIALQTQLRQPFASKSGGQVQSEYEYALAVATETMSPARLRFREEG